ncbi:uncharacterized protein EV154DRAFT_513103 [Mucor mucedo]|uniref:uncharacterized protein n=1 Tax=Mucor mucedo TaxID=29922 RepID=UPI00221F20A5|nr:uncharacterized protein EV154DRAFT_513103 [Mucor mucedo]KAI7889853.1 hypothetical protein EV154DRAFT_513103 [Mucor mucedo]
MDDYIKPMIDISIPGPYIQLDIVPLTLFYMVISYLDYYLYCRTTLTFSKYKHWHRLYHLILPFLFAPKRQAFSTAFIAFPWFVASVGAYSAQLYKYQQLKLEGPPQSFKDYVISVGIEGLSSQGPEENKQEGVRVEGVRRVLNHIIIMALGKALLTPILLHDPKLLLAMPWYSWNGIWFGFLMGFKGYTLMLCTDMGLATIQILTGVSTLHVFNRPFLASSPKDFWGNRWNLVVRNLFRKQLYTKEKKPARELAYHRCLAFLVSGLMHESIMTLANRTLTLEQFCFFTLHGFAVLLQSLVSTRISSKLPRSVSIVLTMLFFGCTSQLFLAPFLRYEEQCALFGQHSFI